MAIGVLVLTTVLVVLLAWKLYLRHRYVKCLEKFPGPPPLPFVGNVLEFASSTDLLPAFLRWQRKYGDIVKISVGPTPSMLVVTDYKLLELILTSNNLLDKSHDYQFLYRWLGTGLLISRGTPKWKRHRKILTPAFHFQILEQFIDIFHSNNKTFVRNLGDQVGKQSFDVYPLVSALTLDVICETAMGTSVNAQNDTDSEYVRSVKHMCKVVVDRAFSAVLQQDLLYRFSSQYRKEKEALRVLHEYSKSVISNRKAEFLSSKETGGQSEDIGIKKKLAFLDLMLEANENGQVMSDEDIREEVDTFMFAGHDTTAAALGFTLYTLSKHTDVQNKVVEELKTIFPDGTKRAPTYRDLQEMKYMDMVIKEVLRIYPSVPFYARNVHEDTEYDGGILPKDLTLVLSAYVLHRNPDVFPDPEKFDPERFTAENSQGRSPYAYLPFSAGPRNCIGQKFAMLAMKSTLSAVLRHYEILPAVPEHSLKLAAETVLKSLNGMHVRLNTRQV